MTTDPLPRCEFDPTRLILRLDETIPADVNLVSPVVESVMTVVSMMDCAKGKEMEVETALREALVNAIVHGCKNDATKKVQFCVSCDEAKGMLIVVRNPGEGFDPASLPNPTVGQSLFENHGRGIYLINQLMDEVRFEQGGTEIHMRKR